MCLLFYDEKNISKAMQLMDNAGASVNIFLLFILSYNENLKLLHEL